MERRGALLALGGSCFTLSHQMLGHIPTVLPQRRFSRILISANLLVESRHAPSAVPRVVLICFTEDSFAIRSFRRTFASTFFAPWLTVVPGGSGYLYDPTEQLCIPVRPPDPLLCRSRLPEQTPR